MERRQLWKNPRPTSTGAEATPVISDTRCTSFALPSEGYIVLSASHTITLTQDASYQPHCVDSSDIILTGPGSPTSTTDFRDPFYASSLPEAYALAAATVIAYMLVIMLLITPRTFLHEGAVVLGRRGFTNGPSSGNGGIGIGGRPWLQKVAAASVAISLTIATADTFSVAKGQYEKGFMDAAELQDRVENGDELKYIRIVSDTFLWLAQAQTLIRLFPRQREKIIIKWTAFALISLDVLFSILNNLLFEGNSRPRTFVDAIPALSYLFQLALSLLYCAWVIYYSLTKKRFAFYHPQMKNQCLVALLSLMSVLIPVVFFVLDISKPDVAGWGDYVRWVGAAAASVVVWEWVERIEALERNEKKDGVLGREVFDGDEMLDVNSSSDSKWTDSFKNRKGDGKGGDDDKGGSGGGITTGSNGISWPGVAGIASRYRPRASHDIESGVVPKDLTTRKSRKKQPRPRPTLWPTRPPAAATPVSRTDTASAESTVYAVRYHPLSEATPPIIEQPLRGNTTDDTLTVPNTQTVRLESVRRNEDDDAEKDMAIETQDVVGEHQAQESRNGTWQNLAKLNPFKRKVQAPPPEVSAHAVRTMEPATHGSPHRWDVRAKLEDFAVTQADKFREKTRARDSVTDLPVTVIPAPTRRRNLEAALEELNDVNNAGQGERDIAQPPTQEEYHPQRLSDPYRPDDLNGHSIYQRGTISFLTNAPQQREQQTEAGPAPEDDRGGSDMDRSISPVITRNSPVQLRSPSSATFAALARSRDGLPVMSISAPARKPKSDSGS